MLLVQTVQAVQSLHSVQTVNALRRGSRAASWRSSRFRVPGSMLAARFKRPLRGGSRFKSSNDRQRLYDAFKSSNVQKFNVRRFRRTDDGVYVKRNSKSKRKKQARPQLLHFARAQGRDQRTYFPLGNSLEVIQIDRAVPWHSVRLCQQNFGRNVANRRCNRCNGDFSEKLQRRISG